MNRTIEFIIAPAGELQSDAVDFKRPACEKTNKFLEDALSVMGQKIKKPEYNRRSTRVSRGLGVGFETLDQRQKFKVGWGYAASVLENADFLADPCVVASQVKAAVEDGRLLLDARIDAAQFLLSSLGYFRQD